MTTPRTSEHEDRVSPLHGNAAAIRAVAAAVEGTLGPKGLNCMLVDRLGEVVITNDGSTILEKIDATHPAAKLLVQVARAQDREVGDGTTTATILASALIAEGVAQVERGVPVTRIVEGMRAGIAAAVDGIRRRAIPLGGIGDPMLRAAALIAGREQADLAELCLGAAAAIGRERLEAPDFRLADWILARDGADSEVVPGVVLEKEPVNRQMPRALTDTAVLCLDDALEPEELEESALGTEAGFAAFMRFQTEFREAMARLAAAGVRAIFVTKAVHAIAEELLTEAGALVVRRLSGRDMPRVARHTGATLVKRAALRKPAEELAALLGHAESVRVDERSGQLRVLARAGEPMATMLVGAATPEVREERRRVAEDAACAVQAALRGGVTAGGGAAELAAIADVEAARGAAGAMAAYGADCVLAALRAPLAQMVANAGFNPLEKVEAVLAAMARENSAALAIHCDTGEVTDMLALGVVDPAPVKIHALRAAGEVAEAILRINTIIRKREDDGEAGAASG
ncbi:MAG TPA: TCP-1/cpn60 chaperonin family protein [Armatimonadota bacterium]|nr:TCP-1/cpn60 chaperonin family protein [Armatimonadota bacterium]